MLVSKILVPKIPVSKMLAFLLVLSPAFLFPACFNTTPTDGPAIPASSRIRASYPLEAGGGRLSPAEGLARDGAGGTFVISNGTSTLYYFIKQAGLMRFDGSASIDLATLPASRSDLAVYSLVAHGNSGGIIARSTSRTSGARLTYLDKLSARDHGRISIESSSAASADLSRGASLTTDGSLLYDAFYDGSGTVSLRAFDFPYNGTIRSLLVKDAKRLVACAYESVGRMWFFDEETPGSGSFGWIDPTSPSAENLFEPNEEDVLPPGIMYIKGAVSSGGELYVLTADGTIHELAR
jgi:hypothetical protein